MQKQSKFIYFLITLTFFLVINFYLSNIISYNLLKGFHYSNDFIKLTFIKNTGAAFSIMQDSTTLLSLVSLIATVAIFYYVLKYIETLKFKELFCISFLLTGVIGNMYERIHFGYVRDFFDLTFINFPIFNISDVFINIGVFAIIIMILLTKKQNIIK